MSGHLSRRAIDVANEARDVAERASKAGAAVAEKVDRDLQGLIRHVDKTYIEPLKADLVAMKADIEKTITVEARKHVTVTSDLAFDIQGAADTARADTLHNEETLDGLTDFLRNSSLGARLRWLITGYVPPLRRSKVPDGTYQWTRSATLLRLVGRGR